MPSRRGVSRRAAHTVQGIDARHKKACAAHSGAPCSCRPAYRARVWSPADRVARSRAAQGLPPKVTDPSALARTAELLRAPDDLNAVGVDHVAPAESRLDEHALDVRAGELPAPVRATTRPGAGDGLPGPKRHDEFSTAQAGEVGLEPADPVVEGGEDGKEVAA